MQLTTWRRLAARALLPATAALAAAGCDPRAGDLDRPSTGAALLFSLGKSLIGLYIGRSGVASAFGAAASLAVLLVWVYWSAQIFLLGAEFTWVWANRQGSLQGRHGDGPLPSARHAAPPARLPQPALASVPE